MTPQPACRELWRAVRWLRMESAGLSLNVGPQRASDRSNHTFSQAVSPAEDKYRRLRLSNARMEATLAAAPNALPALQALGWQADPEAADFLVCPKSVRPSMAEVTFCHSAIKSWRSLSSSSFASMHFKNWLAQNSFRP